MARRNASAAASARHVARQPLLSHRRALRLPAPGSRPQLRRRQNTVVIAVELGEKGADAVGELGEIHDAVLVPVDDGGRDLPVGAPTAVVFAAGLLAVEAP